MGKIWNEIIIPFLTNDIAVNWIAPIFTGIILLAIPVIISKIINKIENKKEIDRVNILNATKAGLTESIKGLKIKPDLILVDALTGIDTCGIPYMPIVKGDAKCYSIAAASIIAKVTRDRIMRQWHEVYPEYNFIQHKGYGTAAHIAAIKEYGLCPLHRLSFVKNIVGKD